MFEKILVPLDTSEMSEQALPFATELAQAFNSQVDIINVCEPHQQQEASSCESYVNTVADKLANSLAGHKIKTEIIIGAPHQKILDYVKIEEIDLIMMSSHGRSGVTLWPLGGTVEKVLRQTGVPLIIAKVKEAQSGPPIGLFKRILVALDGSDLGGKVVPYVSALASKLDSEIILLHVVETDKRLHSLGRIDTVPFRQEELISLKKRAQDYLNQVSKKFSGKGSVVTVVKTGNVGEEIIKYSLENNVTLIAISSHGHSGLESWVLGSVTNKILHASNKSMFFVPALEA